MNKQSLYHALKLNDWIELGQHHFTKSSILEFAQEFDPQVFHLDEEAASKSNFGGLCASGWQTLSQFMPLNLAARPRLEARYGITKPAEWGVSPGIKNAKWRLPVYVDDILTYRACFIAKRESNSRKGWGILTGYVEIHNQNDVLIASFENAVFLKI